MADGKDDHPGERVAIALQAEPGGEAGTARVTARGHGLLAEQILAIAFARGVRVREDAALAAILEAIELDSPLPTAALVAVAEIFTRLHAENERSAAFAGASSPAGEENPASWT